MDKTYIIKILRKYLSNRFPATTEEKVQKWIIRKENSEENTNASYIYWNDLSMDVDAGTYTALERVNKRIGYPAQPIRAISFRKRMIHVAAVIVPCLVIIGSYLYFHWNTENWIELSVAYGDKQHVILPDSSEVWLNSGTQIRYPEKFNSNNRTVYLDGEAYFSVIRNESYPFIIQADELLVKVLGTQFNVKAYSGDERMITTLNNGKVEVNIRGNNSHILKPNEQLIYNIRTTNIEISEVPVGETHSWLTGQIIFSNNSINEILRTLERRFNVSFKNAIYPPLSGSYTIRFLKNENLDEILHILGDVMNVRFNREKDTITIVRE